MNICFITAGPIEWASSRMRAYWVAEALRERGHEVKVFGISDDLSQIADYEVCIWQKVANLDYIKAPPMQRHYWDVCDPSWWWQPNECREIAQHMTAVVASSNALAKDYQEWHMDGKKGVGEKDYAYTIPDRLKLSHFHTQRQHSDVSPVRLIWFGIAANRVALWGARANLERLVANGHKIELTIFDDRPDVRFNFSDAFPIYHVLWELSAEVDVLSSHDVALLPPYPGPWGEVKSDNKKLTAWACGIPAWTGENYCNGEALLNAKTRAGMAYEYALDDHLIEQSAIEWEALLS